MDLCNEKDIRALLARHGFRFSKSMGQNFLIEGWVPRDIAEASGADQTTGVLEIGPGIGPLTVQLARRAAKVAAVELDRALYPILDETLAPYDNVEVVPGDVMKLDLAALAADKFSGLTAIACANLPYNITTPVLTALIEAGCFASITVMIQREVALRICAAPGTADYQDLGYTTYTLPQWGITGPEAPQPEEVTYTYTFADLHTEQVTAPAGEAPQAPANTADSACVSNSDGTHTYNKYSWPAWEDGTTEYTEIATPTTEACDMQETTPATPPVHEDGQLIDGTSAVMTCSKCGYQTGGETIPAGEHDYQFSEELSTAATCVAKGENVYVCSVCGDTMTEETEIDPNNHANVVTDAAVAATCTATGLTEGSHCEACSTVIVEQEEIPALGHDYQITETTGATCVTAGKVTYTCSRCDDTYTEEGALDPNNHEGDVALDPETVKEATRGEDGYTGDTVCSACGAVVTPGEVIPALGVMITVVERSSHGDA